MSGRESASFFHIFRDRMPFSRVIHYACNRYCACMLIAAFLVFILVIAIIFQYTEEPPTWTTIVTATGIFAVLCLVVMGVCIECLDAVRKAYFRRNLLQEEQEGSQRINTRREVTAHEVSNLPTVSPDAPTAPTPYGAFPDTLPPNCSPPNIPVVVPGSRFPHSADTDVRQTTEPRSPGVLTRSRRRLQAESASQVSTAPPWVLARSGRRLIRTRLVDTRTVEGPMPGQISEDI